jgi:hypothetical protein
MGSRSRWRLRAGPDPVGRTADVDGVALDSLVYRYRRLPVLQRLAYLPVIWKSRLRHRLRARIRKRSSTFEEAIRAVTV